MTRAKTQRPKTEGPKAERPKRAPTAEPTTPAARAHRMPPISPTRGTEGTTSPVKTRPHEKFDGETRPLEEPPTMPHMAPLDEYTSPAEQAHRPHSVVDDQLVEITELPDIPTLQVAIHEIAGHLGAAKQACALAGHVPAHGATGRDGVQQIISVLSMVDVVIVGIPGGEPVIDAALALAPRNPVVIAACSGNAIDAVGRANATGADLATTRPHTPDTLAPALLAAARLVDHRRELTTSRGSEAVLRARLENLTDNESGLQSFEMFQKVLELELKRARRYQYPLSVALFALELPPPPHPPGVRGILRARAGNALVHTIRDIDLATELDQERFLVLLPYTDLGGAAELARRVLKSVTACEAVIATGRAFSPKFIGAVAGANPHQQLSFARLMRDATRALEQARHDGAELAIQP